VVLVTGCVIHGRAPDEMPCAECDAIASTCMTHGEPTCCEVCCDRRGEPGHAPLHHVHQMFCERCNDVVEWLSGNDLVAVRRGTGGVTPDGFTNQPPIDYAALPTPVGADLALIDDNGVRPWRESVRDALLGVAIFLIAIVTPGGGGAGGGRGKGGPPPPPPPDRG
jgi:hypothetical protein